ncbi:MAG: hypothetical protein ACC655_03000, partial [Rhodothermia bacterium]
SDDTGSIRGFRVEDIEAVLHSKTTIVQIFIGERLLQFLVLVRHERPAKITSGYRSETRSA